MAHYIHSTYPSPAIRRLLFLVGEQRRDIIPRILHRADEKIEVEELEVYSTVTRDGFKQDLEAVLSRLDAEEDVEKEKEMEKRREIIEARLMDYEESGIHSSGGSDISHIHSGSIHTWGPKTRWIVVFSPAGTTDGVEVVKDREHGGGLGGAVRYRICTIGPTTKEFMVEKCGREPDVVAEKPSPDGLMEGILRFDGNNV